MAAIKPFYDNRLATRASLAWGQWHREADAILDGAHPDYQGVVENIGEIYRRVTEEVAALHEAQNRALDTFHGIQLPAIVPAEPEIRAGGANAYLYHHRQFRVGHSPANRTQGVEIRLTTTGTESGNLRHLKQKKPSAPKHHYKNRVGLQIH